MKIKQEIEWVVGENPEGTATKLIAIKDDGGILIQTGSFYADEEASAPCWHFENGDVVPPQHAEVLAWASMPTYEGFPAEGQKVEFTNVHKCDQDPQGSAGIPADHHPDPVVERLIEAVKMLGREAQRQLGKEYDEAGLYERQGINSKLYRLGSLDEYVRTGKDQP